MSKISDPHHQPWASQSRNNMLTNSILIQTDDGRKYDSSILYNRIIDDPYYHHRRKQPILKPLLAMCTIVGIFTCLIFSESIGFSSFSLVSTMDNKYLRNKPNVENLDEISSIDDEEDNEEESTSIDDATYDALTLADDDIDDELRLGTEEEEDEEEEDNDIQNNGIDNEEDDIEELYAENDTNIDTAVSFDENNKSNHTIASVDEVTAESNEANTNQSTDTYDDDDTEIVVNTKEDDKDNHGIPEGWVEEIDPKTGKIYYYHKESRISTWERPAAKESSHKDFEGVGGEDILRTEEDLASSSTDEVGKENIEHSPAIENNNSNEMEIDEAINFMKENHILPEEAENEHVSKLTDRLHPSDVGDNEDGFF